MTQSAIPASFSNQGAAQSPYISDNQSGNSRVVPRYHPEKELVIAVDEHFPQIPTTSYSDSRNNSAYRTSPTRRNQFPGNGPQPVMYVRALYDYEADDRTSLSFHEGDIIQVITQLESGWWDGVINGVRGWFPSNYCQVMPDAEGAVDEKEQEPEEDGEPDEEEEEEEEEYEDQYDDDDGESDGDDDSTQLPIEGASNGDKARADFWIPQATSDGRLFYFNTMTGESSMELPLESPSSITESGPRDRMNVNIPEKTRPPPELMAQGLVQDEDYESEGNSASELEGESIMMASSSSLVC